MADTVDPVVDTSAPDSLLKGEPATPVVEPATPVEPVVEPVLDETFTMEQLTNLMGDDIKENALWGKFNNVQDFGKSMVELQKLVGAKGDIPKDDATDENWNEFYTKMGRPDKFEDYGVTPIEGLESITERLDGALELAHKVGMTKKQTTEFFNGMMEGELKDVESLKSAQADVYKKESDVLTEAWGDGMDTMIDVVTRFEKTLGVYDAFEAKGINKDADVLIMMGELAKRLDEDPEVTTAMSSTPNGIENEISMVNTEIAEFIKKGDKVPPHLTNKRAQLFERLYKD